VLIVSIYSSKTGAWMCKESEWREDILVCKFLRTMFLNDFMHMLEVSHIVAIDIEGKPWRKILRPPGPAMSIHGDQGHYVYVLLIFSIRLTFQSGSLTTMVLVNGH
jgi:hypothetical protein